MKKLDALIANENNCSPLTTRYSKKLLAKYAADMRYLVDKVEDGACIPAARDLQKYFKGEYGMTISEGSIRRHTRILQAGQEIWPK